MGRKVCISLFDWTGNWARPFAQRGYDVLTFDTRPDVPEEFMYERRQHKCRDVLTLPARLYERDSLERLVLLMAPPCTHFSCSGAQYWKAKDADGRTAQHVALVEKALALMHTWYPDVWALENPVGRVDKLVPELQQQEPFRFDPCDFGGWLTPPGDAYTKKTQLWGRFMVPEIRRVEPVRVCPQGSWLQKLGGSSERTKQLRSATPMGFAEAFAAANA